MILKIDNLENLKCKGIYSITNTTNGKMYIGSTWKSFGWRYKQHTTKLRQGKHHCSHMQRAWEKYGGNGFLFEILEIIKDRSLLLEKERFYIEKYNSYKNGYNENPNPNLSPMFNDSSRLKSSTTHKKLWDNLKSSMTEEEFKQYKQDYLEKRGFVKGKDAWNKGLKMSEEQTKNMKKPKVNGVSEAMKEVHRRNSQLAKDRADYVIVYDANNNWLNTFWCSSDLVEYSKSVYNDLPMKLRANGTKFLDASKIANHIKNGKLYKGLYFKRAPKSRKLSYANGMNLWKAETQPIISQAEGTPSEGSETTGEVQSS